ncbi:MAG: response regulator [Phycisphaerae bacterium]|nr:response regulator [Phycisphaerae bacterium]
MQRILVLTDEKRKFTDLENMLKESGEVVLNTFTDSLDLLEKFLTLHSELIILDVDLLNGKVINLMNILRSIKKDFPIVLLLSKEKMSICSKAFSLGIVLYLIKPVTANNIYDIVSSTLHIQS